MLSSSVKTNQMVEFVKKRVESKTEYIIMHLYKSKLCPHLECECVVLVPVKKDMVDKKNKINWKRFKGKQ